MEKNKSKVLALLKILLTQTDEEHQITIREISDSLAKTGYDCSDYSIRQYMSQLREELDIDIISSRGRKASYFIGERLLQKADVKLLIDCINASNFINLPNAIRIVKALTSIFSEHEVEEIKKTTLAPTISKTENNQIIINIDAIQEAIDNNCQIDFEYLGWNKDKKLVRRHKWMNSTSPWTTLWANDRYYLLGYHYKPDENGNYPPVHYRIDKMRKIELKDWRRKGEKEFNEFDAKTYVSRRMGMFAPWGQKEESITVEIEENLIDAFIDQYGKEISIEECSENKVKVEFTAVPTKYLAGWLMMINARVLESDNLKKIIVDIIKENKNYYNIE